MKICYNYESHALFNSLIKQKIIKDKKSVYLKSAVITPKTSCLDSLVITRRHSDCPLNFGNFSSLSTPYLGVILIPQVINNDLSIHIFLFGILHLLYCFIDQTQKNQSCSIICCSIKDKTKLLSFLELSELFNTFQIIFA